MLKGFLLGAVVGGIVTWVWRDTIREYVEQNVEPAKSKVEGVLRTVQETSEGLLDTAKDRASSTLETARDKVRSVDTRVAAPQ
jgi:ElaB/YqjD/DUF883 family membrane-anchored ribosome-binding protein